MSLYSDNDNVYMTCFSFPKNAGYGHTNAARREKQTYQIDSYQKDEQRFSLNS